MAIRNILHSLAVLLYVTFHSGDTQAQQQLSPDRWRSDLKYFQELIHTKYPNLFYNVTAQQFDSAVTAVDKKIPSLNETQIRVEFVKLVAMFKVGHTNVRLRYGSPDKLTPWVHFIPVRFYLFSDGMFIKSIHEKYKDALGGKIIKIGNTPVETALQKLRPVVAFENEQGFRNLVSLYLSLPEMLQAVGVIDDINKVELTYQKDGTEKTIVLQPEAFNTHLDIIGMQTPEHWVDTYENINKGNSVLWMKEPAKLRYFEYLKDSKTVYVRHSAVQNEENETIAEFFAKVFSFVESNDVDKFILDIRLNGGGNNYLNKPVITGIIQSKKINRYGHLFIITGRSTFSAAQNLTNELEKYTEAVFIGEPTSENVNFYGDTRSETLPNSQLNINLSWLWWQNLDPRDKRLWKAPLLATDLSFSDYRNGIDPAMNAAMDYKNEMPFEETLKKQIADGKYDEAIKTATSYKQDPLHRYGVPDMEDKINNLGYEWMNQNKFKEANQLFYINVLLFPGSANAYDSYAESFWKLGNKEDAIKNYNIAVSKDPNGPTGENSKRMLKEIGN